LGWKNKISHFSSTNKLYRMMECSELPSLRFEHHQPAIVSPSPSTNQQQQQQARDAAAAQAKGLW
jgi:hypothetical protein